MASEFIGGVSPRRFAQIPNRALDAIRLLAKESGAAVQCFLALVARAGNRGFIHMTAKQLSEYTGLNIWTTNKALATLIAKKFIARHKGSGPSAIAINAALAWKSPNNELWSALFIDGSVLPEVRNELEEKLFGHLEEQRYDDSPQDDDPSVLSLNPTTTPPETQSP